MGFGEVKWLIAGDLGSDRSQASLAELPLVVVAAGLGLGEQGRLVGIDGGAILAAAIIALAHALGGVVTFPEQLEQIAEIDGIAIPNHPYHFRMAGAATTNLFVTGIGGITTRVAHGRGHDSGEAPESLLGPPEAATGE